jgi:hypothetical protein
MILSAYIPSIIKALIGGLFIAFGIYSFGQAEIFEPIFLAVIIFTGVVCRANFDVVSILVIVFCQNLINELAWQFILDIFSVKFILYGLSALICFGCRYDKLIRFVLPLLLVIIGVEIYWLSTGYAGPNIVWHVWLLTIGLSLRYLLFARVGILQHYFKKQAQSINLDWSIYKLMGLSIVIQSAMLTEYLVRHISHAPHITYIYDLYPYIAQALATVMIWVIFHENAKLLIPKFLKV